MVHHAFGPVVIDGARFQICRLEFAEGVLDVQEAFVMRQNLPRGGFFFAYIAAQQIPSVDLRVAPFAVALLRRAPPAMT